MRGKANLGSLTRAIAFGGAAMLAGGHAARADANADLIAKGKYLTDAGDCMACHTADDSKPFAGGKGIPTPFGTIYSNNITPDKDTGIGTWNDEQFYRALHDGVSKNGDNIYPAMPYQWYTRVTREDVAAIKAYMFSIPPVNQKSKANDLSFPFNIRAGLTAWNALYFHPGEFKPDPSKSAQVNRGAYLVEGLGHCAACHTPKNVAQAPVTSKSFAGEPIQGWYAPNISSDVRQGIGSWSNEQLVQYFKTGVAPGKAVARGPMAETVHDSLSKLNDDDLLAMAAYLKSTPGKEPYEVATGSNSQMAHAPGESIYLSNCAFCHQVNGQGNPGVVLPLAENGTVKAQGAQDVIRVVLAGVPALQNYAPMPAIGGSMTDGDIASVVNYVRQAWGNGAPANATASQVADLRKTTRSVLANNETNCPAVESQDVAQAVNNPATGIAGKLRDTNQSNLLLTAKDMVAKVKAASPKAQPADIVNGLTAAYCPIVNANKSLGDAERRWHLDQFAQIVYLQVADHGHN